MTLKKIIVAFSLPLFLSSLLFSQALVELARKEKDRRKSLSNQKVIFITHSNLRNLMRRPALTVSSEAFPTEVIPPEETTPQQQTQPPEGAPVRDDTAEAQQQKDVPTRIAELEQKWNSQKEYVTLLNTRLNGLWQEYYSMDDMSDRGGIQKEIAETSQKLEQAQKDEVKTREELENLRGQVKR